MFQKPPFALVNCLSTINSGFLAAPPVGFTKTATLAKEVPLTNP